MLFSSRIVLPAEPFVYGEWKTARVNIDYHVELHRHYCSVPFALVHEAVEVRLTATNRRVLLQGPARGRPRPRRQHDPPRAHARGPPAPLGVDPLLPDAAASQTAGRAIHKWCLAQATKLDAIEQQDGSSLELMRVHAGAVRAEEIMDMVRRFQTTCPVCGERLGTSRGVLFQGDSLVHAACWRDDSTSFADPPPSV